MIIEPTFKIGQRVYGSLPDSPVGLVLDINYRFSSDKIEYQVTFGVEKGSLWYDEIELSETKTFV